jgi:REP element-mobilizing transposase RayT
MARPLRLEFEGGLYHVTSRGDRKEAIFLDDVDRETFLEILCKSVENCRWIVHAYCLMGNHYHLLVETPEPNLSRGMRQLNGVFTQRFNARHQRVGHVFQGRFKALVVDREGYLLELCRYVVLNPVRAGMVDRPQDWEWSSYRATAGMVEGHRCLSKDWVLGQFGADPEEARRRYRSFVQDKVEDHPVWEELKGQILLGDDDFVKKLGSVLEPQGAVREIPRIQRLAARPDLETLLTEPGKGGSRSVRAAQVRQAFADYGYTQKAIADFLGLHPATVSLIIRNRTG